MRVRHRFIFLTRGMIAVVDHADFERAAQLRWRAHQGSGRRRTWYASTMHRKRRVYLHRWIAPYAKSQVIDHADGDGLNCRRGNFRYTSHRNNAINHPTQSNNTSGFKGVDFVPRYQKYRARITTTDGRRHLGLFALADQAARAYDRAARKHHGRYARLNFPR